MSTKTQIANRTAVRIGAAIFVDVDTDGTTTADQFNAIWDGVVENALEIGPEKGWRFAKHSISDVAVNNTAITVFADYSGTATGTVLVTSVAHGLLSGDQTVITGTTNYDAQYKITKISADTFYITATFVADDATGTSQWTSRKFLYRYARPTSTAVESVYTDSQFINDWNRQGDFILTSQSSTLVDMDYTKVLADLTVGTFPAHFNEVIWRQMAIDMLYSVVQSQKLQDRLTEEIETIYLPRAIGMDSREFYVQEQSDSWQAAGHTTRILE
jgi:hypothetical protein